MKTLATLFILLLATHLLCADNYAQEQSSVPQDQKQASVDQFVKEILVKNAEAAGQERARINVMLQNEKRWAEASKTLADLKVKAAQDLTKATADTVRAEGRLGHGATMASAQDASSGSMKDYEAYERSVSARTAAKMRYAQFSRQESQAVEKFRNEKRERENAEREAAVAEAARAERRSKLEQLYGDWRENKTDAAYKSMTGHLTEMARVVNLSADVKFFTQNSATNSETEGADIRYETDPERGRNEQPLKSPGCTTVKSSNPDPCMKKSMTRGWYYIWSVRGGSNTSDTTNYIFVDGPTFTVKLTEKQ